MIRLLRFRGGTGGRIANSAAVIGDDEIAIDTISGTLKVGDGSTPFEDLPAVLDGGSL